MSEQTNLLAYRSTGEGTPIILLHGLFGSKENLGMLARPLSASFQVISVDLRNHGQSFHSFEMNYPAMAQDVMTLMDHLEIKHAPILGHSMGGKVAMQLALNHPERISVLIAVDIAPVEYPPHHEQIMAGLQLLAQTPIESRQQADEVLARFEPDLPTRQFLLTNLVRGEDKTFHLRLNIQALTDQQPSICKALNGIAFEKPALFIRGGNSHYVMDQSLPLITRLFPNYQLTTINNAGHMVHAEQTAEVVAQTKQFLDQGVVQ